MGRFMEFMYKNNLSIWEYGNSKQSEGWEPIRLLVSDEKNNPIGIAQVLVKEYSSGLVRLNRGPLLVTNKNQKSNLITLINVIHRYAIKNKWCLCWLHQNCILQTLQQMV